MEITRATYEHECDEIFSRAMEPVYKALEDARLEKTAIDEIILVGGSTRIPAI